MFANHDPRGRRQRWAWCALALWVVGFDAGPLLHTALHGSLEAHTHGPQRSASSARGRTDTSPTAHRHADGALHTHAPRHEETAHGPSWLFQVDSPFAAWRGHGRRGVQSSAPSHPSPAPSPATSLRKGAPSTPPSGVAWGGEGASDHGEGSLAHHDVAAQTPLPGLPPVPEAPFAGYLAPTPTAARPSRARGTESRARAPPAHALLSRPS